jgi:hypothetical protein
MPVSGGKGTSKGPGGGSGFGGGQGGGGGGVMAGMQAARAATAAKARAIADRARSDAEAKAAGLANQLSPEEQGDLTSVFGRMFGSYAPPASEDPASVAQRQAAMVAELGGPLNSYFGGLTDQVSAQSAGIDPGLTSLFSGPPGLGGDGPHPTGGDGGQQQQYQYQPAPTYTPSVLQMAGAEDISPEVPSPWDYQKQQWQGNQFMLAPLRRL